MASQYFPSLMSVTALPTAAFWAAFRWRSSTLAAGSASGRSGPETDGGAARGPRKLDRMPAGAGLDHARTAP